MKKDLLIIFLKVLSYAIGLLLAYFCASAFVSCTVSRSVDAHGQAVIISTDTTFIEHKGFVNFPRK